MKKIFNVLLISLVVIGCQPNSKRQTVKEKIVETNENKNAKSKEETTLEAPEEYKIDIYNSKVNERNLKIVVTTNFPDGTNLLLSVGRPHYLKGKNEIYSGDIFSSDFTVKRGEIETTVEIDDSKWYNEHKKLVKQLPNDIMPIKQISDEVEISVTFSPARTQSKKILDLVGEYGENLNGEGISKLGKLTTFKASKKINIPFEK